MGAAEDGVCRWRTNNSVCRRKEGCNVRAEMRHAAMAESGRAAVAAAGGDEDDGELQQLRQWKS